MKQHHIDRFEKVTLSLLELWPMDQLLPWLAGTMTGLFTAACGLLWLCLLSLFLFSSGAWTDANGCLLMAVVGSRLLLSANRLARANQLKRQQ